MCNSATEFGSRLRRIRRAAGITQEQLANMVNIDAGSISRYEKGAITPGLDTAYALAVALDVTLNDLLPTPAAGDAV